jgi:hypothetical protein
VFDTKSFLVGMCSGFGICFGLVVILAVIVDLLFVRMGIPTISERVLSVSRRYPAVPALLAGVVCLIVGMLFGHLWFYQTVYIQVKP